MEYVKLLGQIFLLMGSFSLFVAAVGLLRMPDVYNRVQTGTKASTLGTILSLFGIGLITLGVLGKIILLIIFILITNPVSSHLLARAAHYSGIPLAKISVIDKLKSFNEDKKNKVDTKAEEK